MQRVQLFEFSVNGGHSPHTARSTHIAEAFIHRSHTHSSLTRLSDEKEMKRTLQAWERTSRKNETIVRRVALLRKAQQSLIYESVDNYGMKAEISAE